MAETLNTYRASQDGGVGRQFRATRYLRPVLAGVVAASFLTGCAELRHITMTKDELRLYGNLEVKCLDPIVVCIRP
jgi:hypothetical protein